MIEIDKFTGELIVRNDIELDRELYEFIEFQVSSDIYFLLLRLQKFI